MNTASLGKGLCHKCHHGQQRCYYLSFLGSAESKPVHAESLLMINAREGVATALRPWKQEIAAVSGTK